ncbi:phosphopantetheine-binding protein [Streptomyces sp. NBC_00378]|uniref:phosphopantetheine-binding protein n=1 Tax=unclassified Streptomyces TaxID=2593676 RepID=UPI002253F171|nr:MULTISPECIES: phosphopantetheine-binding protein [unclassified Streptomyces]MCX5115095.1 phosphopantetheine-binding protein [Streptomyces sp. NBC_00378]
MTIEHPADVLTDLIGVLGDVLRVKPEKIDPDQTFPSLGLDSLLIVEFVAVVNGRYGLQVRATDLYDYPTPASFAQEVGRARAAASTSAAPAGSTGPAVPADAVAPAGSAGSAAPEGATRIAEVLREQLAAILCCDAWEINTTAAFNVLGMDSIVAAEFIAAVNRTFGLRERSVLLYEHPNLAAVAAYIATRTGAFVPDAEPVRTPVPVAASALRPTLRGDVDVLLDAIRDDRLTVDEAVVLLARRG